MQDAKILSSKDIARLQKATARLSAIVGSLGNGNGASAQKADKKVVRRRRKKRTPAEAEPATI